MAIPFRAFPNAKYNNDETNGMELRDYFAAQCPHKFDVFTLNDIVEVLGLPRETRVDDWTEEMSLAAECKLRYRWADAMMEARKK